MNIRKIVQEELRRIVAEQEATVDLSPFSDAEKAFLGKFAQKQATYLGIIYSKTDVGIQEFLTRSGDSLNLNSEILNKLLKDEVIELVPYGGYGRNEDYTIHLKLDLKDVDEYKQNAEQGAEGGAGGEGGSEDPTGAAVPEEAPAPMPEDPVAETPNEWTARYGDILVETARTAKRLVEQRNTISRKQQFKVYAQQGRVLNRLPKGYVQYLERIIMILAGKLHNDLEREHLVADILDNLAHNFGLTPKQILRSYIYYRNQNRLQRIIGK
jgi:hypothetical protein